ncbi:putative NADPH dehydrogenase C23G7.10c [Pseudocercospora fuligena]|uniref:Putative NADPH dehydrogenase C23G7.10c n=1 Tax=Pseudocercospora fuligena TaxID=685502 RepID=A0A8H6RE13_9PEZI|nr:putative NADPH dehydrogenase C23G7.10c [Pseudocercospora fuligena]
MASTTGSDYTDFRSVQEPGIPYFTPKQSTPVGAALLDKNEFEENTISAVFRPLTIRGVTFCNRIFVSPMCMYSCSGDGMMTDFHLVNAGQFALRGAALVTLEATAVLPSGLNSVQDAGLWSDEHISPLKRIVDFIHSQSKHAAIQLQHAGRKASICPPWLGLRTVPEQYGGFPDGVLAPTAESWNDNYALPKEMTPKEICEVILAFGEAAKRAVKAGCRIVAVHGAHGYLIHSFASPASNKRTDMWGGSFENRIKFAVEIIRAIRRNVPPETLLFWKISAVDWLPPGEGWELEDTLRFAPILAAEGVDMLDVSSGGTDRRQKVEMGPQYQVKFAKAVKDLCIPGLYVGAVGWIRDGATVADIIENRKADFCSVAREFLRDPNFVQRVAMEVGTKIAWPDQYHRASYEGSYVESTTSISTDAKAHVHITRDNTLDQAKPPSAMDTNEPADTNTDA